MKIRGCLLVCVYFPGYVASKGGRISERERERGGGREIQTDMSRSVSAYIWWNCGLETQCAYKSNIEARSRNQCCRGKAISITYSDCESVALVIQSEERMRRVILSSVGCWLYLTFPHFLINGAIFGKYLIEYKMRVFFSIILSDKFSF